MSLWGWELLKLSSTVHWAGPMVHCFKDGISVQRLQTAGTILQLSISPLIWQLANEQTLMHLPQSGKVCRAHCALIMIIYRTEIFSLRQWLPRGWQFLTSLELAAATVIILISYLELLCKKQLSLQLLCRKEEVAPHGRTELENKLEHEIRGREQVHQILERSWSHLPGLKYVK